MNTPTMGLSSREVEERRAAGQVNDFSGDHIKTVPEVIVENLFTVFNLVNFSVIFFLFFFFFKMQDTRLLLDSIGIFFVTIFNLLVSVIQEIRSIRKLAKMDLLKDNRVKVIRDGEEQLIPKKKIVKDDVLVLKQGDQIVVDGTVLNEHHLEVDESLLTGESIPVKKYEGDKVLSGSFSVYGSGSYRAEGIGKESHAAEITALSRKYKFSVSPLLKRINIIFVVSFIVTIIFVAVEAYLQLNRADFNVETVRKISTIAISLIPEGLIFFSSITFLIGIYRIAKLGTIVQKINAIDAFSTLQVVCLDKTGTLTQNNMTLASVTPVNGLYSNDDLRSILGSYAHLVTDKNATVQALTSLDNPGDAVWEDELPFRSDLKLSALTMRHNGGTISAALGAYDVMLTKMPEDLRAGVEAVHQDSKLGGYRNLILGAISGGLNGKLNPENAAGWTIEPLCIVSLKDEARPDSAEALRLFSEKGIEPKLLSGDSKDSVMSTLEDIGWRVPGDEIVTGSELAAVDTDEFQQLVRERSVFVRLQPEQKLKIVKTLKRMKKKVAVIGDGVNDLPAIKTADLGIAMEDGSHITKEASDIILLNNRFSLLPSIYDEGHKVINTVNFVSKLYLTKNFIIVILSFLAWFYLVDFPLTPRSASLLQVFAVAFPAFFISLFNSRWEPGAPFFKDIFAFMFVSAPVIFMVGWLTDYLGKYQLGLTGPDVEAAMTSALIIIFIVNYACAVVFSDSRNALRYLVYGVALLALYVAMIAFPMNVIPFNVIRMFYEVRMLHGPEWELVVKVTLPGATALTIAHYLRHRYMERIREKEGFHL